MFGPAQMHDRRAPTASLGWRILKRCYKIRPRQHCPHDLPLHADSATDRPAKMLAITSTKPIAEHSSTLPGRQ